MGDVLCGWKSVLWVLCQSRHIHGQNLILGGACACVLLYLLLYVDIVQQLLPRGRAPHATCNGAQDAELPLRRSTCGAARVGYLQVHV